MITSLIWLACGFVIGIIIERYLNSFRLLKLHGGAFELRNDETKGVYGVLKIDIPMEQLFHKKSIIVDIKDYTSELHIEPDDESKR